MSHRFSLRIIVKRPWCRVIAAMMAIVFALFSAGRVNASDSAAPMASDPLSVVKRLYAAFDAGDMAAVYDSVAENVIWTYYGPAYSLPFGGVFHGKAGVEAFFRAVDDTLTDVRAGQRDYLVSGEFVSVPGWEESTVKATRAHYRVDNLHLWRVRNGKIIAFEEFINSSDVLEAYMPADLERGKAFFTTCVGCHGRGAAGRHDVRAPNLTGLSFDYTVRQLRNFRADRRGGPNDTYGFMMHGRASALAGDRAVRDVAAFIISLPAASALPTLTGDVVRGARLYETCGVCHGSKAEGSPDGSVPPLRQQDDRYLRGQLRNFMGGIRGMDPSDEPGSRMKAASSVIPDDNAVADVVAFIKTLQ